MLRKQSASYVWIIELTLANLLRNNCYKLNMLGSFYMYVNRPPHSFGCHFDGYARISGVATKPHTNLCKHLAWSSRRVVIFLVCEYNNIHKVIKVLLQ